ncbi:VanZ family protein [Paenibacillus anseongensis]|nr:VanZ family protein [Paenibacillus sp. CGMCC 1.16610]
MGVNDIFSMLLRWIVPAVLFIGAITVGFLILYKLIYRKFLQGNKKVSWTKFILSILLTGYLFIVFAITTLSRSANFDNQFNLNLISGFLDVWNNWSLTSFLLLVYNLVVLSPLGILLPFISRKFQSIKNIFLFSVGFTLLIESYQWVTHRGIFELDDLVHNTIGALSGYLIIKLILSYKQESKIRYNSIISAAIIPFFYACLFVGAIFSYHSQEFGNMSIRPSIGTDMSNVSVSSQIALSQESRLLPIYYDVNANQPELALNIISKLQRSIPLPLVKSSGRDGDNKQYSFEITNDSSYHLTYFTREGTWSLFDELVDTTKELTDEATGQKIEHLLKENSFIPSDAELKIDQNGTFRWDAPNVDPSEYSKDFLNGMVMVDVTDTGKISNLSFDLIENKFIRNAQVISPSDAFEKIKKGKFDSYNSRKPYRMGDQIKITGMKLMYQYDSKGYYQPVYEFDGSLNDEVSRFSVRIPALP